MPRALLLCSNVFMTFAWYAHLKNLADRPWYIAALVSWGIALFEYLLQVPANRIGYTALSLAQLKILQEVITLAVFVPFAVVCMRQPLKLDYLWAALHRRGRLLHLPLPGHALIGRVGLTILLLAAGGHAAAQGRPERARDLGIPLDGSPGPLDAITDVAGVSVGHATIIRGEGRLRVGVGPVRTGVTVVFPRGRDDLAPVFAGWFSLNGNGEMTGTAWIDDYGILAYPVALTNTNSVGTVRDAVIEWARESLGDAFYCCLPVVAETFDGDLNDIFGFHVHREHLLEAIRAAAPGPVTEGSVGGGTGMTCLGFKGGIGTASRRLPAKEGGYTVGALVQCNFGLRRQLRIAGVPVGQEIPDPAPCYATREPLDSARARERCVAGAPKDKERGSIIVIVATDAPLLPHQLRRIARRASLGVGRMGSISGAGSGDLFLAFSTAPTGIADTTRVATVRMVSEDRVDPLYEATVQATEEAIINAMLAARTMTGADWYRVPALPHGRLRAVLARHGRLLAH